MDLSATIVTALAVAAALTAVVALVLAAMALRGQREVRSAYGLFSGGNQEDVLSHLRRHLDEVASLRRDVAELRGGTERLRGLLAGCLSRVATLRYDAFDDEGGRLSYSTALLDEHGDGVVLTSIHRRADTRTYAKPIQGGQSRYVLSTEEASVVERALAAEDRPSPEVEPGTEPLGRGSS